MKLIIRASAKVYREHIQDESNQGRLPLAWLTFGSIAGHGWAFLHPWAQLVLFPAKGTRFGIGHPDRKHEPFFILRYRSTWRTELHPNHEYAIEGRYWYGLVWRRKWGWRPRRVLLDYDCITVDEQILQERRAEDFEW